MGTPTAHDPPNAVFYLFIAIVLGAMTRRLLKYRKVPVELVLFFIGILLGILGQSTAITNGLGLSLLWERSGPTVLYAFLPIVAFDVAYSALDSYVLSSLKWHCLQMSVPGVLFGSLLTGFFTKLIVYKDWTWGTAILFGAVTSVTDPVASSAWLQGLGANKSVSTILLGESMLSESTAVLLYDLLRFQLLFPGQTPVGEYFATFFLVLLGGPVFGYCVAMATFFALKTVFNDIYVSASALLGGLYLTFYVAEELRCSGVMAVFVYSLVMTERRISLTPELAESLQAFWQLLVFISSTLLWITMGAVTANTWFSSVLSWGDYSVAGMLYFVLQIVRLTLVFASGPVFTRFGSSLTWQEKMLVTWGGLRGTVGLCMALSLMHEPTISKNIGDVVGFQTANVVLLSVLVNGLLARGLIPLLNLGKPARDARAHMHLLVKDARSAEVKAMNALRSDVTIADADWDKVIDYSISKLEDTWEKEYGPVPSLDAAVRAKRELIRAFGHFVWQNYLHGLTSGTAVRTLSGFAEELLEAGAFFNDAVALEFWRTRLRLDAVPVRPLLSRVQYLKARDEEKYISSMYEMGITFLQAQQKLLLKVNTAAPEKALALKLRAAIHDAIVEVRTLLRPLTDLHPQIALAYRTKFAVRAVLNAAREDVMQKRAAGVVEGNESTVLMAQLERTMASLLQFPKTLSAPNPLEVLRATPWFLKVDPKIQGLISNPGLINKCEGGAVITERDADVMGMGLVVSGVVTEEDGTGLVDHLGPGRVFNLSAVLTQKSSRVRVTAACPARFYFYPRDLCSLLLRSNPQLVDSFWLIAGRALAASLLAKVLPYALWDTGELLQHCQTASLFQPSEKAVVLWPSDDFVLVWGQAVIRKHGAARTVMAPCVLTSTDNMLADGLSRDTIAECKKIFEKYDSDGSGYIEEDELAIALQDMGFSFSRKDLHRLMEEVDADCSGKIEFDEFLPLTQKQSVTFAADAKVLRVAKGQHVTTTDSEDEEDLANEVSAPSPFPPTISESESPAPTIQRQNTPTVIIAPATAETATEKAEPIRHDSAQSLRKYKFPPSAPPPQQASPSPSTPPDFRPHSPEKHRSRSNRSRRAIKSPAIVPFRPTPPPRETFKPYRPAPADYYKL
eukprot:TRINITY_DN6810_c0_g1_i1.p1 TRINITY_DN6810_c0_g1~~TRINITY_DN6810_c0_g1_i1.p1  ORF type:complete len:1139 (-),score=138.44 TRINITY_DN6810_c0_g1_i1:1798-5190(-)